MYSLKDGMNPTKTDRARILQCPHFSNLHGVASVLCIKLVENGQRNKVAERQTGCCSDFLFSLALQSVIMAGRMQKQ